MVTFCWGLVGDFWQSAPFLSLTVSSCQFVVSEDQDYTVHFADPDTLVNWDFVEQVVSSSAQLWAERGRVN